MSEDGSAGGTQTATDAEGSPLTFSIVSDGSKGKATITNPTTGTSTYQPNANVNGTDSFTFRASDGTLNSNPGTVTVTISAVNDAPLAVNDSTTTAIRLIASRGWFRRVSLRPLPVTVNLLANDSDVDGSLDPATLTLITPPSSGTATVNAATGTITYLPDVNAFGAASFSYAVRDNSGALSAPATVTITVTAVKRRGSPC